MKERGSDPTAIISYLQKSKSLVLSKNRHGYEVVVPLKGKLVGDFDGDTLVIKSFLWSFRENGKFESVVRASSVTPHKIWSFHNSMD